MRTEVTRYLKSDGYPSRYWAVLVDGELLAVTVYRKGAEAVASALTNSNHDSHGTTLEDSANRGNQPDNASTGLRSGRIG
ncbi:MAG: hypothetical protein H7A51_04120 [Akkermansiaceae bacterium]|nr:hypothetical protein [Akkermansiaceae bacterium]